MTKAHGARTYRRITNVEGMRMVRLKAEGLSDTEIGRRTGESRDRVSGYLRRFKAQPARVMPPLPVADDDGFIKQPTKAQLMGKR